MPRASSASSAASRASREGDPGTPMRGQVPPPCQHATNRKTSIAAVAASVGVSGTSAAVSTSAVSSTSSLTTPIRTGSCA